MKNQLPIEDVLPQLLEAVRREPCVVLSAAPGAGKTTRVPLALLDAGIVSGRIIMLEPRRLAAVRAAQYMARQRDEAVGAGVGYRIRGDSRVSAQTRIEVVTEGVLANMIQQDPELSGVSVIIFDEFHERSLHVDLGLALARDVQKNWRHDLKILVMSATLDGTAVSALLDNAPIIISEGRQYPVDIIYVAAPAIQNTAVALENHVATVIRRALQDTQGDVLVFLPGQRELRRVQTQLEQENLPERVQIHLLYGESDTAQQQKALQKAEHGDRKIILSTSIAETSLTIDGVCVVVDAGLVRTTRFDVQRGMSGLTTTRVSQATAAQRAGRAGRQQAGICYRLWHESQQQTLARFPTPDILHSDLMPLALELACWGVHESQLAFLDAPPVSALQQARDVLRALGALDDAWRVTAHGRAVSALPVHPRYAHMLLRATEHQMGALACEVAALLDECDVLRGERDVDFFWRWQALHEGHHGDRTVLTRVRQQAARLRQLLGIHGSNKTSDNKLGLMLALCYPERVACRRDERGERWQLANGVGAVLPNTSTLMREWWIAVAEIDGENRDARIVLAAALDKNDLPVFFPEMISAATEVQWSSQEEAVTVREVRRFGKLVLSEKLLPARGEKVVQALCGGIRLLGWQTLPLPDVAQQWLQRAQWLFSQQLIDDFPDVSTQRLLATLETWLAPFLVNISRHSQLTQIDWLSALQSLLSYSQSQQLEQLAPAYWVVPTGSRIALNYSGEQPVLPVRIQEMFGATDTPRIAEGKIAVLVHLLSPRQTPLAITQDLTSFWKNSYSAVRKDMRGQYPKHYWPENPLEAEPTKRTKAADDRVKKNNR